jgi:hypothetical protein
MMGCTKRAAINEEVRKALNMSDAELLAWFNRQMSELAEKPRASPTEIDTLRLLLVALVEEVERPKARTKRSRLSARVKG